MTPVVQGDSQEDGQRPAIDPISRVGTMSSVELKTITIHTSTQQILQRTQSQHKLSQPGQNVVSSLTSGLSEEPSVRRSADSEALRRSDTVSSKAGKDKK